MSVLTIRAGGLVVLDPSDVRVIEFDWEAENLPDGVTITSSSYALELLKGSATPALTKDQESILSGSRSTQVRLSTIADGAVYRVSNTIVTSESPSQTKEQSYKVLGQQR